MFVLVLGRSKSRLTPVLISREIGRTVSGGYGGGDIPVPIPNTAVKPTSADGTWGSPPGRVGRRRDFLKGPHFGGGPSLSLGVSVLGWPRTPRNSGSAPFRPGTLRRSRCRRS